MPRGDRTGPDGAGPKTGRALGYCVGNDQPGYASTVAPRGGAGYGRQFYGGRGFGYGGGFGRGFGGGRGFGFGGGHGFGYGRSLGNYYVGNAVDVSEKTLIENEIRVLKDQLSALEKRLADTTGSSSDK